MTGNSGMVQAGTKNKQASWSGPAGATLRYEPEVIITGYPIWF